MSSARLYTSPASGNSYKVRLLIALLAVDADIEYVNLNIANNEHKTAKYLNVNPRGQIPCFVEGDTTLTDSNAILVYLAGKYSYAGGDAHPSSFWSSDLHRAFTTLSAFPAAQAQPELEQWFSETKAEGCKALGLLEDRLAGREWLVLDGPTIADISIFVYVALAPMGDISLEPYPGVRAWIERIKQLPRFLAIDGLDDPMYMRRARLNAK